MSPAGKVLLTRLRHHITGAIERGEAAPVVGIPASPSRKKTRMAKAKTKPKRKKQTHGFVVVQQGGSSTEMYVHAFDTSAQAYNYRRSCDRSAYNHSESIKVPLALIKTDVEVGLLERIAQAAAELV